MQNLMLIRWVMDVLSAPVYPSLLRRCDSAPLADLAPLYEHLCKELGWGVDAAQLEGMKTRNAEKLKELDEKIKDAEENLGETEVRDAVQAKADYYAQIGDREAAAKAYQDTESKTASVATKTDLVFNQIRCAAQQQGCSSGQHSQHDVCDRTRSRPLMEGWFIKGTTCQLSRHACMLCGH